MRAFIDHVMERKGLPESRSHMRTVLRPAIVENQNLDPLQRVVQGSYSFEAKCENIGTFVCGNYDRVIGNLHGLEHEGTPDCQISQADRSRPIRSWQRRISSRYPETNSRRSAAAISGFTRFLCLK